MWKQLRFPTTWSPVDGVSAGTRETAARAAGRETRRALTTHSAAQIIPGRRQAIAVVATPHHVTGSAWTTPDASRGIVCR